MDQASLKPEIPTDTPLNPDDMINIGSSRMDISNENKQQTSEESS